MLVLRGSVYIDGLYDGHGAGGGMVWEEHQVCYVPIKAIFCECNNSIVEAIVFPFSLCGCEAWLISRYSRFFVVMLEVVEQVRVDVPDIEFCCPPSVSVRSSGKAGLGRVRK